MGVRGRGSRWQVRVKVTLWLLPINLFLPVATARLPIWTRDSSLVPLDGRQDEPSELIASSHAVPFC